MNKLRCTFLFLFSIGILFLFYLNYSYSKRRAGFKKMKKDLIKMEVIKLMGQPDNIRDITKDKSEWNYSLYMTPFVKSSTISFEKNRVDTFYVIK